MRCNIAVTCGVFRFYTQITAFLQQPCACFSAWVKLLSFNQVAVDGQNTRLASFRNGRRLAQKICPRKIAKCAIYCVFQMFFGEGASIYRRFYRFVGAKAIRQN